MASKSALSIPNLSKKPSSSIRTGALTPAPSLLSLRSVIDFMPNDIRLRYKDAAKCIVWPECPLDGNGQASELNEEDEFTTTSNLNLGKKLKRNFTNESKFRAYSNFGNVPVVMSNDTTKFGLRNRRPSDTTQFRDRNFEKPGESKKKPPVVYFSSKDGGDVNVRLVTSEMTRL